ncbi:hypothetical protein JCM10908_002604 [Rhodotorula pacifica]|uniref:uncharacterized protein n=1 Tax=Rhodotorula pacifica TaxID=1495444 RepID=UPI00316E6C4F
MLDVSARAGDPNFPPNLAIAPSCSASGPARQQEDNEDNDDARQDIAGFGIAGRTWEAAYLLRDYLLPPSTSSSPSTTLFDPPCPLFDSDQPSDGEASGAAIRAQQTVLELGSGTGFLSLAIAPSLRRRRTKTTLIMTDLDNVCPLLEDNLARARERWSRTAERDLSATDLAEHGDLTANPRASPSPDVLVRPLPWGDRRSLLRLLEVERLEPDIILASDLIYFEFLYGPLLRTLIALTEPRAASPLSKKTGAESPVVIFSYKVRSLTREEPFWRAFGRWFAFDPVQIGRRRRPSPSPDPASTTDPARPPVDVSDDPPVATKETVFWSRYGSNASFSASSEEGFSARSIGDDDDELYVFVCRRHPSTFGALGSLAQNEQSGDETLYSEVSDKELLLGLGKAEGHAAGADRFEEILLANLEWD